MLESGWRELQEKYDLTKDDFWTLKRSGKEIHIISMNGCKKIQAQEKIVFSKMEWINRGEPVGGFAYSYIVQVTAHRVGEEDLAVITTGEANSENVKMNYPVAMVEKRAKDRAILDIVGLAKEGFYSVVDMTVEEWENAGYVNRTAGPFTSIVPR